MTMDRATLLRKIAWNVQAPWHFRHQDDSQALSVHTTVMGLQALLLAQDGAMLRQTLQQTFARAVALSELKRLEIGLYQEGRDQRVWRALATLQDGASQPFGLIVARAPGPSDALTRHDFGHLQTLHTTQARFCVQPYVRGTLPIVPAVTAYTVEWLEQHKELVFEIAYDGGVFLINAPDAQQRFTPQESRRIWRQMVEILWWYPTLRRVNIQAGDFVGYRGADGHLALQLTTARQLVADTTPAQRIHTLLASVITASGYLSDGHQPFPRSMPQDVFLHRMQAVLQRRFAAHAPAMAQQQWQLFAAGVFARQEDWLKEDCILATYDRLRAEHSAMPAWEHTCQYWQAYAAAVESAHLPPSWWFPAAEIPTVLHRLSPA